MNPLKNTFLILKGKIILFGGGEGEIGENPKQHQPQYANIQHLWDHGQKVTRKTLLIAEHLSEVFSPHNNDQAHEVEQDLATPIQSQEHLRAFTLKEIKYEIKMLNQIKAPGLDLIPARMLKELPNKVLVNLMYIFSTILRP
jgi:hypothetical protein